MNCAWYVSGVNSSSSISSIFFVSLLRPVGGSGYGCPVIYALRRLREVLIDDKEEEDPTFDGEFTGTELFSG